MKNKTGFTLLEIVVTMGILVLLIFAITRVYSVTFKAYNFALERSQNASRWSQAFRLMEDELSKADGITECAYVSNTNTYIRYLKQGIEHQFYTYTGADGITRLYKNQASEGNTGVGQVLGSYIVASTLNKFFCRPDWGFSPNNGASIYPSYIYISFLVESYNLSSLNTKTRMTFRTQITPRNIPYVLDYWWTFDETSGSTAYDYAGYNVTQISWGVTNYATYGSNSNYGSLHDGVVAASGVINGALEFNGSDGYVSLLWPVGDTSSPGSNDTWYNFTVSFWANPSYIDTEPNYAPILTSNLGTDGAGFYLASDALYVIDANATRYSVPVSISTGTWYHVAYTYDYNLFTMIFYLNGKLISQQSFDPTAMEMHNIGSNGKYFFNGKIDDVRWYTRTLSANEVARLARYGSCCSGSPLTCTVADLQGDTSNCGACANACGGGQTCASGVCT